MDKNVIIRVEGLSKKYLLGRNRSSDRYTALRDVLAEKVKAPWRYLRGERRKNGRDTASDEFWALRDVNLEVRRGDVVGIIGRNGAGKSTLLKILSRITEPTAGRITLRGRVASLLEVGTGFHPELTGRENIFLNGAILGMQRSEIKAKFDEIVAFAEVEKFLDTPVKRYSSGMYVRLAFAVAASLDPEILVVDEVLAVGDVEFQKKCLGKMKDVASHQGRTVLFVSHNLDAVLHLCSRGLLLQQGRLVLDSTAKSAVEQYRSSTNRLSVDASPFQTDEFIITKIAFTSDALEVGRPATFVVEIRAINDLSLADLSLLFYSVNGTRVGIIDLRGSGLPLKVRRGETMRAVGSISSLCLVQGEYSVGIFAATSHQLYDCYDLMEIVVNLDVEKMSRLTYPVEYLGYVHFEHKSQIELAERGP